MFGCPEDFLLLVDQHILAGNSSVYVVLHSTNGVAERDADDNTCEQPFQVKDDIWICKMHTELRNAVYEACESPGFHRSSPTGNTASFIPQPFATVRGCRETSAVPGMLK